MRSDFFDGLLTLTLANAGAAAPGGSFKDTAVEFFQEGGPFMYVNVFWFACALAVVVERSYRLFFVYSLNAQPFMEQITRLVSNGNVNRALVLCNAAPNVPLVKVVRAGLARADHGEIEVSKAVEEAMLEHAPPVQARLQWLWSLANIATLVGLIGTIIGLIGTFKSLGNVPAEKKQELLSAGISEAMNNTAFGLTIAVTCIVFHLFLTSYAKRLVETIELNAMKLENALSKRVEPEVIQQQPPRAQAG